MIIHEDQIALFIHQYFLPFCRIGAMFMVMPIIGARTVAPTVRLMLAFLVTIIVVPLLPMLPVSPLFSLQSAVYVVQEILIGVACGFVFQIVFQVFVLSGLLMAMKMGLGFASMNDPTNGVQTTALSQFFLMMVTLMFVSVDGHVLLIQLLVEGFHGIPPGVWLFNSQSLMSVVVLCSWMFSTALVFALPVLTALLVVNIAFGVMSRAAPQLNIFAVGFPFTLVVGLVLVWYGLNNFVVNFERISEYGFMFIEKLLLIERT